jgi:hypothetical protein
MCSARIPVFSGGIGGCRVGFGFVRFDGAGCVSRHDLRVQLNPDTPVAVTSTALEVLRIHVIFKYFAADVVLGVDHVGRA